MGKDVVKRQSSEIEKVRGKHHVFPRTRSGWVVTGATGLVSFIACAASHFDGGTVLGGLFVSLGVSTFSDDALHALLYGKRFPEQLAMSNSNGKQFRDAAADLACRWLGWERDPNPRHGESFKSMAARWLGMPVYENDDPGGEPKNEPFYEIVEEEQEDSSDRMVVLADKLKLDINDIAGKAIFICGIRRSGKTTLGVRIAEEMGKFNVPMFIPDLKGDWLSCVKTLPNAVILGKGEATEKNAKAHGYAICEEGIQIILDVTSYDDMNEVAKVIASAIDGVFLWERKHPEDRSPCAIFLDEAQSYLPQNVNDSIIPDATARDIMMNAYMRVIAIGGSLGLFPVILTQRIAQTNNKIIGQPELLFLFKQSMDNDFNRYKNFTNVSTDQIRGLKQGQGIFVDIEGKSTIHQFHKRTSSDAMSKTPRVSMERRKRPAAPTPETQVLGEDDYEGLDLDLYDETEQDPLPGLLVRNQIKIGTDLTTKRDVTISKEQFDMLLNMRSGGLLTGFRQIMKVMPTLSETHARNLNSMLLSALGEESEPGRESEGV
jgi:hypothetical protein